MLIKGKEGHNYGNGYEAIRNRWLKKRKSQMAKWLNGFKPKPPKINKTKGNKMKIQFIKKGISFIKIESAQGHIQRDEGTRIHRFVVYRQVPYGHIRWGLDCNQEQRGFLQSMPIAPKRTEPNNNLADLAKAGEGSNEGGNQQVMNWESLIASRNRDIVTCRIADPGQTEGLQVKTCLLQDREGQGITQGGRCTIP